MGYKHTEQEILDGAVAVAFDDGLSRLTFGRVAKRLGINDRVVVYYFPTTDDLIRAVVFALGGRLQETLAEAFVKQVDDHRGLVAAAWPVVTTPEADAVFAVFFEANGLASSGREPYDELVPALVEQWIAWAAAFIDAPPADQRIEAETAVALIDGLLLLRQLGGPDSAERAARRLGVR